jgi:hypothetical protein
MRNHNLGAVIAQTEQNRCLQHGDPCEEPNECEKKRAFCSYCWGQLVDVSEGRKDRRNEV